MPVTIHDFTSAPTFEEKAAVEMVTAAARAGMFQQVKAGKINRLDLRLARELLTSTSAKLQYDPTVRDMFLTLIGEAERYLRQNPDLEPGGMLGNLGHVAGIFDSIWGAVKSAGSFVFKGAKTVFEAGAATQAQSTELQQKAQVIAANVASAAQQANDVMAQVKTGVTAQQLQTTATDFLQSDTGKLVMYGGLGLLLVVLVMSGGRRR